MWMHFESSFLQDTGEKAGVAVRGNPGMEGWHITGEMGKEGKDQRYRDRAASLIY